MGKRRNPSGGQDAVTGDLTPVVMSEGDREMARPRITLTLAQRDQVEGLASVLSQEQMADYFGIARNTLLAIMEREPEIHALYKKGRAKAIGAVAQGLLQRARNGDTASAIFYLKTQGGWREVTRIEAAQAANPLQSVILFEMDESS